MVMSTGFPGILSRFGQLVAQNHVPARFSGQMASDQFALWTNHMMLLSSAKRGHVQTDTIVHEMTHAYQDIVLRYPMDNPSDELLRLDEGEAFAVEGLY